MTELRAWLGRERDGAALAVYRVVFGTLVAVSSLRFLAYGWVDTLFDTRFRFHYLGFGWVPFPGIDGVRALFVALVVLGTLVALGAFYRLSIVLLFVCFTWVQLLDVSNYLNHYYLVCLLALLMSAMPLNGLWSLDARWFPSVRRQTFPAWCTAALRFQVGVVYCFAALAKLNEDWLVFGAPLHLWLSARASVFPWLSSPAAAWFASWAGFLFDASAPLFLSFNRTRPFAYAAVITFHVTTSLLFPIGMFPFIMMASTLAFFSSSWPRALLRRWRAVAPVAELPGRPVSSAALALLVGYGVVQVALPLRTHVFGGDVSWHEQGMRFSWRVMTREKNGVVTYVVREPSTSREWHVSPRDYLTGVQERELAVQPDLILQLAHHIGDDFASRGHRDVEVRAETSVSLNGRQSSPLVDPTIDLLTLKDGVLARGWVTVAPNSPPIGRPLFAP